MRLVFLIVIYDAQTASHPKIRSAQSSLVKKSIWHEFVSIFYLRATRRSSFVDDTSQTAGVYPLNLFVS